jgi:hypothetical protein
MKKTVWLTEDCGKSTVDKTHFNAPWNSKKNYEPLLLINLKLNSKIKNKFN